MKPVVLCILDGCGISESSNGNAFLNAKKDTIDMLMNKYPHSVLQASGESVGLPDKQMGTSEVGHMNFGAGRIAVQPLEQINQSIRSGEFFNNEEILKVINHVKNNNSTLHVMGLLSDGGIHSSIEHLMALIEMCAKNNLYKVAYHIFTDGRDSDTKSALKYIKVLEDKINSTGVGKIATIQGRYYAMDRDNNFDRLKKSYDAMCYNEAPIFMSPEELIEINYSDDVTDEFIVPGIINSNVIKDGDGVITYNFRKDRLREMFTCLTNPNLYKDEAQEKHLEIKEYNNLYVVTMFPVVESVIAPHAFDDLDLTNMLGEYLHKNNLSQLRIAETEKYAHVTFFFDGGNEIEYNDMKKILIPSPKVATYDLKPEMSVYEVTDAFLNEVENYDVTIMNLANGDMVGHTGNYEAAKEAVEHMDKCLGKIYNKIQELGGVLVLTADHGNCEKMINDDNTVCTTHTTNPVFLIITKENIELENGVLADIAPTIIDLLGYEKPVEMTGHSLIK